MDAQVEKIPGDKAKGSRCDYHSMVFLAHTAGARECGKYNKKQSTIALLISVLVLQYTVSIANAPIRVVLFEFLSRFTFLSIVLNCCTIIFSIFSNKLIHEERF